MPTASGGRLLTLAAALLLPGTCAQALGESVYFLVAERPEFAMHGDSYVLPLTDPAAIDHARALIGSEPGELSSIIVATIAPRVDGINRDYLAPGFPAWSWHVTEFHEFADFTIEILDGWPGYVEQDVEGWIANTGGLIGFWNYTVIAEVAVIPEPATLGLAFAAVPILAAASTWRRWL